MLMVESGVSSAGLITQVFPQTSAGKSFHDGIAMGKFHGGIMPHTPTGGRMGIATLFERWKTPTTSRVSAGLRFSKVCPERDGTHSASIRLRYVLGAAMVPYESVR